MAVVELETEGVEGRTKSNKTLKVDSEITIFIVLIYLLIWESVFCF